MRHAHLALIVAFVTVAALGGLAALGAPEARGQVRQALYLPSLSSPMHHCSPKCAGAGGIGSKAAEEIARTMARRAACGEPALRLLVHTTVRDADGYYGLGLEGTMGAGSLLGADQCIWLGLFEAEVPYPTPPQLEATATPTGRAQATATPAPTAVVCLSATLFTVFQEPGAWARIHLRWRHERLNETPAPTEAPGRSTATASATPTPTPTGSEGPVTATPTRSAAARYLFVERWEHQVRGPGCGMMLIDFPTYQFYPDSGILRLYLYFGRNPLLEDTDVGYCGSGRSVEGHNSGGEASKLLRIVTLPFEVGDLQVRSVDPGGAVLAVRGGEDIALAPGAERRWQWVGNGETPGCTVTTTLRVTNYGYQDRSKIELRQAGPYVP
jgi:hypothetical protein